MDLQSLAAATEQNHRAFGFFKPLLAKAIENRPSYAHTQAQRGSRPDTSPINEIRPAGETVPPRALPAFAAARAHEEKRPPRARRPALPQPGAAVLSAKAGLTAGFGMGPGDPRLCGRARGGRSPAAQVFEPARSPVRGDPGGRMAGTGEDHASRSVL